MRQHDLRAVLQHTPADDGHPLTPELQRHAGVSGVVGKKITISDLVRGGVDDIGGLLPANMPTGQTTSTNVLDISEEESSVFSAYREANVGSY